MGARARRPGGRLRGGSRPSSDRTHRSVDFAAIAQALDDQEHTLHFLAAATGDGAQSARRKYLDALEEGGATEARTRREYFDRYPIELLQNAHDACADARMVGKAQIVVTQHGLLMANQ